MINKRVVLLRVEHLQHGRGRVALVVAAHFVDLVQQNNRVYRLCLPKRRDNSPGHCADVGFSVTANFRLVADAAERDTRVFASERLRNGASYRGLAHSGRTVQADYLPLDIGSERPYRQCFENTLLDLCKPVVILVELLCGCVNVQLILGSFIKRNRQHSVKVIAQNGGFL